MVKKIYLNRVMRLLLIIKEYERITGFRKNFWYAKYKNHVKLVGSMSC